MRNNRVDKLAASALRTLSRLGMQVLPLHWNLTTVGQACSIRNELRLPLSTDIRSGMSGQYPYYGPTGVLSSIDNYRVEGTFALIGEDGDHLLDYENKPQTLRISGKFNVNNHAHIIGDGNECTVDWFCWFFRHRDIRHAITRQGASRYKLTKAALEQLPIVCPPIEEQRRIADVLGAWDEAIDKLGTLSKTLAALNSALCQRSFEKEFDYQKRLVRASAIFGPVSERARPDLPLLAVMQDLGIVRRDELDRRVAMPDGDTSNYKVVRPGDFVISLRSFEGGLEYSTVLGLVSPAYTVLRPIREIHSEYYRHFFKSRSFIGRLDKLIFGIRDGKQIAFRDFGDMRIPNPRVDIQKSEAGILNNAECLLALNLKRKQALEKQKRGLMQKLLTGEWRARA